MKKHELVIELVEAALAGNAKEIRSSANAFVQNFSKNKDKESALKIRDLLLQYSKPVKASNFQNQIPKDFKTGTPLLEEQKWPTSPLFLDKVAYQGFSEFLRDAKNIKLLQEHGLASKLRVLLSGPPGTGKSLLAGSIAAELGLPFYVVRLDAIISSRLGETAKNIRELFQIQNSEGHVLFLDEVDAIAKHRNDSQDLGELKRVVNTLIQALDMLDEKAIVIAATNHQQLLDQAILRRFPYQINLGLPELSVREDLWRFFLYEEEGGQDYSPLLAIVSEGFSGSDIEFISLAVRRTKVLDKKDKISPVEATQRILSFNLDGNIFSYKGKIDVDFRKKAAKKLLSFKSLRKKDIADLLEVSPQVISSYLKKGNLKNG